MTPKRLEIRERGDVAKAVHATRRLAAEAGLGEAKQFMAATAVSELARNILAYAGHGWIGLGIVERGPARGVEIVAEDNGPGIEDIQKALSDNFSTGGTLGIGLPGAKRMMDELTIESKPGSGTRVVARKWE
ncbi:MAG: ATP-binding protein [Deltaproteobacteria bacterium]|nr:anti-sigma regulatory factor [Deltaproteobacteria bacterium]RLB97539.1 MAG: ATP-binding protein [Deltaproteobacteria bacterium]